MPNSHRQKDNQLFQIEQSYESADGKLHRYEARHDGILFGFLVAYFDEGFTDETFVADVWVKPSQRRQGVATALLERARQDIPHLRHSSDRTAEGQLWALAVRLPNEVLPVWRLYTSY